MKVQTIKPRADCPDCHGTGEVNDWVPSPFGSGSVPMPSLCGCVDEQTDENTDEVILDLSDVIVSYTEMVPMDENDWQVAKEVLLP